jgi:hypothetical protein
VGAEAEGTGVDATFAEFADTLCLLLPPKSFASLSLLRVGCDMAGDEAVRGTASDPAYSLTATEGYPRPRRRSVVNLA